MNSTNLAAKLIEVWNPDVFLNFGGSLADNIKNKSI
jgi:hypothetical protein